MRCLPVLPIFFTVLFYITGCGGGGGSGGEDFFAITNDELVILNNAELVDSDSSIVVGGVKGSVNPESEVLISNLNTLDQRTVTSNNEGGFITTLQGTFGDEFRIISQGVDVVIETRSLSEVNEDTKIELMSGAVRRNLAQLGSVPTRIEIFNNKAYVLNGFSDNIQIFDITQNPPMQTGTIVLPLGSDPVGIAFLGNAHAYVTNLVSENVAIVNIEDESCEAVISEIDGNFAPCDEVILVDEDTFDNPAGIVITERKVYVANQNLDDFFVPIDNGFITVIDSETNEIETIIDATGQGTSGTGKGIRVINDMVYVVNSGNVLFDFDTGDFICDTSSPPSLDIIDPVTDTLEDSIDLPLSNNKPFVCSPESIASTPDNNFAYIGSQVSGVLFKIDLNSNILLRGANNPIIITSTDGLDATFDIEINEKGYGFIAMFNTDRVFTIDTETDLINPFPFLAEFPVGLRGDNPGSDFFDGPQDMVITNNEISPNIFFITGLSSLLGSIDTSVFEPAM